MRDHCRPTYLTGLDWTELVFSGVFFLDFLKLWPLYGLDWTGLD